MRKKEQSIQASGQLGSRPTWYGNTYFWWAGAIFVLTIGGLIRGVGVITDPGQKPEGNLIWVYFGAGVIMLVNGLLSHGQAITEYHTQLDQQKNKDE